MSNWVYDKWFAAMGGESEKPKWIGIDLASTRDVSAETSIAPPVKEPTQVTYGGRRQGKTWAQFRRAIEEGKIKMPTSSILMEEFEAWRKSRGTIPKR